jgi:hypothetical protein
MSIDILPSLKARGLSEVSDEALKVWEAGE